MKISKTHKPPINRVIWVSSNNWTWFQVKIMYLGRNAFIWRHAYGKGWPIDVAKGQSFHVVFPQWKYKLDGTEKAVS